MPTLYGKGHMARAAWKKGSAWGTAVACGAGDGVYYSDEGITAEREYLRDDSVRGSAKRLRGDQGNYIVGGSLKAIARYESFEPLIAAFFGTAGAPSVVDTTAQKHLLKMNNALEGIFGTLVIDKGVCLHEVVSAKVVGISLRGTSRGDEQRISIEFKLVGDFLQLASAVNTAITFASVTYSANRTPVQMQHLTARINAQGGAALAAGDAIHINEFTLNLERPQLTDDFSTKRIAMIEEPVGDGFITASGSLSFRKYNDATGGGSALFPGKLAGTRYKMDWDFLSTVLAGSATQMFEWKMFFPDVVLIGPDTPQVAGPGVIAWSGQFESEEVAAIPTGFPVGYTDPVTMEIYSKRSTDALA